MCYDPSKAYPQVNLSEVSFLIEFQLFSSILWRIQFGVCSNNNIFSFIKLLFTATLLFLQKADYWFCVFGSKQKIYHFQCPGKYWLHIVLLVFYQKNYFRWIEREIVFRGRLENDGVWQSVWRVGGRQELFHWRCVLFRLLVKMFKTLYDHSVFLLLWSWQHQLQLFLVIKASDHYCFIIIISAKLLFWHADAPSSIDWPPKPSTPYLPPALQHHRHHHYCHQLYIDLRTWFSRPLPILLPSPRYQSTSLQTSDQPLPPLSNAALRRWRPSCPKILHQLHWQCLQGDQEEWTVMKWWWWSCRMVT